MTNNERDAEWNDSGLNGSNRAPRQSFSRRGFFKATGVGLGVLSSIGLNGSATAANSIKTPRLHTDGNWLKDPKGNKVVLRGVNTDGPLFADYYDNKTVPEKIRMATSGDWYARTIRLPCERDRVNNEADGDVQWYAENYIDPAVEEAAKQGVYLIIDWHAGADWDDPDVHSDLEAFWDVVAQRYADREHVLYEMFNEPVYPAENTLENWKAWRETAQPWVDFIREDAPDSPIIIGSPRWTQLTQHADDVPFEGNNLIYAVHLYPTHYESMDLFEIAKTAQNVPVALTEWGYITDEDEADHMQGTTSGYGQGMREWLTQNPSISWTGWCFARRYGPVFFDQEWNLLGGEDHQGEFMQEFLYDTRHDHRPGISSGASPTPTPPSNLRSPDVGETSVDLEWDPPSHPSSEASNKSKSKDNSGNWLDRYNIYLEGKKVTETSSTSTTVSNLSSGTNLEFYITAVDRSGRESEWSDLLEVTTEFGGRSANINNTSTAPQIDGIRDDVWDGADSVSLDNNLIGSPSDDDLSATAYTLYDADNVYVLVEVTDDERPGQDSDQIYQDDAVEVYLDVSKDNESSYGDDDYQYQFRRDGSEFAETQNGATASIEWATAETDAGYTLEFAFLHSTIGTDPRNGTLGFDVHVVDDDDGGTRDAKIAWSDTDDQAWSDPSVFGTLTYDGTPD